MTRALVTNDDGIDSPGLRLLAEVAVEAGLDVIVAAPHEERSGASASLTALRSDGRLVVTRTNLKDGIEALSVEATPAFITLVASRGAFGAPPEIVLSGINRGPNTGYAILHSGTVGAALTAATAGRPALAVSLAAPNPEHWETAQEVARPALKWLIDQGKPATVLNVNVPDRALGDLRGTRVASLATFGAVQANIGDVGTGYVTVSFSDVVGQFEEGTDAALLKDGWATITALTAPYESGRVDLRDLETG